IPQGVAFRAFANGNYDSSDWDTQNVSDAAARAASLYFRTNGQLVIPATGTAAGGDRIAFQLQNDDCGAATSDCLRYIVTVSEGGVVDARRCVLGGEAGTDVCFNATIAESCSKRFYLNRST